MDDLLSLDWDLEGGIDEYLPVLLEDSVSNTTMPNEDHIVIVETYGERGVSSNVSNSEGILPKWNYHAIPTTQANHHSPNAMNGLDGGMNTETLAWNPSTMVLSAVIKVPDNGALLKSRWSNKPPGLTKPYRDRRDELLSCLNLWRCNNLKDRLTREWIDLNVIDYFKNCSIQFL